MSDEGDHAKVKRNVKLKDNTENKRKPANDFRAGIAQVDLGVRVASLAREGTGRIFGGAVFPERHSEATSDSYSDSDSASVANVPRGRSYESESGRDYSPAHPWSDDGRETLSEAVAREKRQRRNVKDSRSRARSRSRGHAKGSKESRARPARSGMPPDDKIFNKHMVKRNAILSDRGTFFRSGARRTRHRRRDNQRSSSPDSEGHRPQPSDPPAMKKRR